MSHEEYTNTSELLIVTQRKLAQLGESMGNGCSEASRNLAEDCVTLATDLRNAVDDELAQKRRRESEIELQRPAAVA